MRAISLSVIAIFAVALAPFPAQASHGCPPSDSAIPVNLYAIHEQDLPLKFIYVTLDGAVFEETNDHEGLQRNGGNCPGGAYDADHRLTP